MVIGLLMVNNEDDILERTLEHNSQFVDAFYALDGSAANSASERICSNHPKCWGYQRDADLDRPPYPALARDGYRAALLEDAYCDHGSDHWFMLIHADELWTANPDVLMDGDDDGFIFRLPFWFPREGEGWDDGTHPIDQLHWSLWPGYAEFRLFRGGPRVHYDPAQHFNVTPGGLESIGYSDDPILHFPYRAPSVQRVRAETHERTGFDPDNYRHVTDGDSVFWSDGMIAAYRRREQFRDLLDIRVQTREVAV